MNEERRMILQMLQDGSISVEEAERLMEAIPAETSTLEMVETSSVAQPRRIKVVVTEDDKTKVNVKVPFSLMRVGLKLGQSAGAIGSKYAKDAEEAQVLDVLKNIDVDELLGSLNDGEITLPYTIVDVDHDDNGKRQHVTVVLE